MAIARSGKKSLRSMGGLICPRCRHHVDHEPGPRLEFCPQHPKTVLVAVTALAEADGDPFLGMMVGGRFAVLELLGAGAMGTVYRARQEAMGRDVALKIVRSDRLVDEQAKIRFRQEAHATSLLQSPHTVTVFDFGEVSASSAAPNYVDGSLFLAMELLDGRSLGARLKAEGAVEVDVALEIMRHALMSLAEAHDKDIIHRDIKPDNLLLTHSPAGDRVCKVLDFGIAKLLTHDGGMDALETQAGTVFGTPRYMSPEQAQGKKLDARSDLYSLGVILYHMLAGQAPFTDGDAVVVMAHHIKTVPPRPTQVVKGLVLPTELEDLLMRVLDKSPAKRPQSARAFIDELEALCLDETTDATGGAMTAVLEEAAPAPDRRRVFAAVAVVLATVLVMGVAVGKSARFGPVGMVTGALGLVAQRLFGIAKEVEVRQARAAEAQAVRAAARSSAAAATPPVSVRPPKLRPPPPATKSKYKRWDGQ